MAVTINDRDLPTPIQIIDVDGGISLIRELSPSKGLKQRLMTGYIPVC